MKFVLQLTMILLLFAGKSYTQHIYQIRADSVRIYNVCDTAELIIENRTRGVSGYLYNKGNGRTEFRKIDLVQVGSSRLAIAGQDTIDLAQFAGVGGTDSAKYILNRTGPAQVANFNIAGFAKITKNGSHAFSPSFTWEPATGLGGANLQLNGEAMPGLAVRVFNGTQSLLHSTFHADGTFSKTGTVGTIGLSSDGMEISFNRNNANYIRAVTPGGYFNFITGGSIRNDTASALTLYANKAAIFRGSVKMDSLAARVTPAATFLAIDNGTVSRRDAADVLSDIAGVGRIPLTTNPSNITAFAGNLNTITNSGIFHIGVAENKPSVQPGYLVSGGNAGLATTYKFQLFGAYNTENELFFRQGISGGNWGPWHKVASEGWVNGRLTADSLQVIRNSTSPQTANFNVTGIGGIGTIYTQTILSNNSTKGLTLIGGATDLNSGRGGQITLFAGDHPTNRGQITFHTGVIMDGTQQPERMRVTKEGNVGIGSTAPAEKLHVAGNAKVSQQVMAPIFASDNSAGTVSLVGGQIGGNHGGQIGLYGGTHASSPGEIILFTGIGSGYQPERMRVTKDGNVGIGTSTPTSLLHVNGNVTATAFHQSSLRTLKKDIHPFTGNALSVLQSARVRSFRFKADTTGHLSIGFIADEVPVEFTTPGRTGVDHANLVGLLVKALQELKTEKDAMETELKAKNEALEARLNAIEALLKAKEE